jgi:hypothetical protein
VQLPSPRLFGSSQPSCWCALVSRSTSLRSASLSPVRTWISFAARSTSARLSAHSSPRQRRSSFAVQTKVPQSGSFQASWSSRGASAGRGGAARGQRGRLRHIEGVAADPSPPHGSLEGGVENPVLTHGRYRQRPARDDHARLVALVLALRPVLDVLHPPVAALASAAELSEEPVEDVAVELAQRQRAECRSQVGCG